jgi:hypothetical protein
MVRFTVPLKQNKRMSHRWSRGVNTSHRTLRGAGELNAELCIQFACSRRGSLSLEFLACAKVRPHMQPEGP